MARRARQAGGADDDADDDDDVTVTEPEAVDRNDPRTSPSPLGGWSEGIARLDHALIVPTDGAGMVQAGGVYGPDGAFCHHAVHYRRGKPLLAPLESGAPKATAKLAGRWMWGGILLNHFGHFLTESTPRLWGLGPLAGQIDGIVWLHKRNEDVANLHTTFLRQMRIELPLHIVKEPTEVETLHIPGQGFGLGRISFGTPAFRDFFRNDFAAGVAAKGAEKLYISRSALGPKKGGALGEQVLEDHLAREGYAIFHPQKHSLEDQIATYRAARQIVALDGSALHLAAFVCGAEQAIAMVRRRSSSMSNAIAIHLKSFTGRAPLVIDAIRADWVPSRRKRVDRFSMGELDLPALFAALQGGGFLRPRAKPWPALDPAWRDGQIAALQKGLRETYLPIVRG